MTNANNGGDRIDEIAALLQQFIVASDERMTRLEQVVDSNNRFLEGFSERIDRYTTRMDNLATKLDNFSTRVSGVIATANLDRQDINTRLSRIENKMDRIPRDIARFERGSQIEDDNDLPG